MSEELETSGEEVAPRSSGPGERLQAARIERGIALADLAHQMHLSVGILESLEDNRFEDIAAPIFVKGYLRSYARIVDLDESEILDLYVSEYMEGDPPIGSTSNGLAEGGSARKRPGQGRWWMLLLLVSLLAAGGWWYQRSQQSAETLSLDAASGPAEQAAESEAPAVTLTPEVRQLSSEAGQRLEQLEPVRPKAVPPGDPARETTPAIQATAASPAPDPQVSQSASPGVEEEAADNAEPPGPEPAAESPLTAVTPAPEDTTPASGDAQPAGQLQMTVTADTWADIRDASGKKLVYNLLRAGRRLSLDGEPPLKLFFGNGHGVELRWKGQPVDLASRIRADNTVRITLE